MDQQRFLWGIEESPKCNGECNELLGPTAIVEREIAEIGRIVPSALGRIWMRTTVNGPSVSDRENALADLFASGNTPEHIAVVLRQETVDNPRYFPRAKVEQTLSWIAEKWNTRTARAS